MKNTILLCLALVFASGICHAQNQKAGLHSPESLGISSQAILDFVDAAEKERKDEMHSFVLLRHGQVVAQGYWSP